MPLDHTSETATGSSVVNNVAHFTESIFLSEIEINLAGELDNPSGLTAPFDAPTIHPATSRNYKLTQRLAQKQRGIATNYTAPLFPIWK